MTANLDFSTFSRPSTVLTVLKKKQIGGMNQVYMN